MKILRFILTAAIITAVGLLFTSCADTDGDILWYERYPLSAVVEANGVTAYVTVDDCITVEIAKPEALTGVRFQFTEDGAVIVSGGIEIPIDMASVPAVYPLGEFFRLKEDMISSVSADGRTVVFDAGEREYTVEYDVNGTPVSFVCLYDGGEVGVMIREIIPSNEKDEKDGENTEAENMG